MWGFSKTRNTIQIGKILNLGNFRTMHAPFQKGDCGNGCRQGVSLSVIQKNSVLFLVFQQNTAIAEKGCKLHKNRKCTKDGGLLFKLCKECYFGWLL